MTKILTQINDELNTMFGIPSIVSRTLNANPTMNGGFEEPLKVVALDEVIAWDRCADLRMRSSNRSLIDCRRMGDSLNAWNEEIEKKYHINDIVTLTKTEDWECDITEVEGLSASKSDLSQFSDMDDFALNGTYKFLEVISEANLQKILKHSEIRIINSPNANDHFERHGWDGRLFLVNEGGSHHFAAARYIAQKLNIKITLTGRLDHYRFNEIFISNLMNDFDIFILNRGDIFGDFYTAMKSFGADFCLFPLPRQLGDKALFLLPKSQKKSRQVAKLFYKKGFYDFGEYFKRHINSEEKQIVSK